MNFDTALKSEYDENSTLVTLDAKLCASVTATEETEAEFVEDAYSTEYELELDKKQYKFTHLVSLLDTDFSVKSEVSTGECGISRVSDIWCDSVSSMCVYENDAFSVKGKAVCCILALDGEGVPYYVERSIDLSFSPVLPGASGSQEQKSAEDHRFTDTAMRPELSARTELKVTGASFRITGDNSIEIKLDMKLTGAVTEQKTVRCITGARSSDDRCRFKDRNAALTLYFASKGESLWDIACAYCTSAEAVKLENEISEDIISEDCMIMIPM